MPLARGDGTLGAGLVQRNLVRILFQRRRKSLSKCCPGINVALADGGLKLVHLPSCVFPPSPRLSCAARLQPNRATRLRARQQSQAKTDKHPGRPSPPVRVKQRAPHPSRPPVRAPQRHPSRPAPRSPTHLARRQPLAAGPPRCHLTIEAHRPVACRRHTTRAAGASVIALLRTRPAGSCRGTTKKQPCCRRGPRFSE